MSFFHPLPSCLLAWQKIGSCSICGYTALSAWETSTELRLRNRRRFACELYQLIDAAAEWEREKNYYYFYSAFCWLQWEMRNAMRWICLLLGKSPTPHTCGCRRTHSRKTINIKTFQEYKRVRSRGTRMCAMFAPFGIHVSHALPYELHTLDLFAAGNRFRSSICQTRKGPRRRQLNYLK